MENKPKNLDGQWQCRSRSEERDANHTAEFGRHGMGLGKATISTNRKKGPPDRRKHQKDLDTIVADLKDKESFIRSLKIRAPIKDLYAAERDGLYSKLREVKTNKDKLFQGKRKTDAQLKTVNQEVQLKHEKIAKLQGKLMYKTAQKVDDVIRSLQLQLERPLKASEQRQVHQKIEGLQKSKETIKEFGASKNELDELKDRQKELRQARDEHVKSITSVKQQEEILKSQLQKLKRKEDTEWDDYRAKTAERDHIRREINELYERKRDLVLSFHREQSAYIKEHKVKTKLELKPNLLSGRRDQDGKKSRQYFKIITEKKKPFDDEIKVCDKIMGYLEKLRPGHSLSSPQDETAQEEGANIPSLLSEKVMDDFMLVKSKNSYFDANLPGIYSGVRRKTNKRDKKRKHISPETNKKVVHHPSVLQQFLSLGIHPPASVAEIAQVVVQITEKKDSFERDQEDLVQKSNMKRRVKSSPTLAYYSFEDSFVLQQRDTSNDSDASTEDSELSLSGKFYKDLAMSNWKHNSCPMLGSIDDDTEVTGIRKISTGVQEGHRMTFHSSYSESSEDDANTIDESKHHVHFFIPNPGSNNDSNQSNIIDDQLSELTETIELDKQLCELNTKTSEIKIQTNELNTQANKFTTITCVPSTQSIELNIQSSGLNTQTHDFNTHANELNTLTNELNTQSSELNTQSSELDIQTNGLDTPPSEPKRQSSELDIKTIRLNTSLSELNRQPSEHNIQTIGLNTPPRVLNRQSSELDIQTNGIDTPPSEPCRQSSELNIETSGIDIPPSELNTDSNELNINNPNKIVRTLADREEKQTMNNNFPLVMIDTELDEKESQNTDWTADQIDGSKPDQTDTFSDTDNDNDKDTLANSDSVVIKYDNLVSGVSLANLRRSTSQDSVFTPGRTLITIDACKRRSGDFLAFQKRVNDETIVRTGV